MDCSQNVNFFSIGIHKAFEKSFYAYNRILQFLNFLKHQTTVTPRPLKQFRKSVLFSVQGGDAHISESAIDYREIVFIHYTS